MTHDDLLERARPLVVEIVAEFCRQESLSQDREAELRQRMLDLLLDDELALLNGFTGERATLESFLSALLPPHLEAAEIARGEKLLLDHLDLIQSKSRQLAGRKLSESEAEDFPSMVIERLCEDGYRVLRRFRGTAFSGYISRVARSVFVDRVVRRNKGRFRPSEAAKRLGLEAEMLEERLYAWGLTEREAIEQVSQEDWSSKSENELREIIAQLPVRQRPLEVPLEDHQANRLPGNPDAGQPEMDLANRRSQLVGALRRGMSTLAPRERLLLKLIFRDKLSVSDCARLLGVEQRPLYRQRDRALGALRGHLAKEDLDWPQIQELLRWEGFDLRLDPEEQAGSDRKAGERSDEDEDGEENEDGDESEEEAAE